MVARTSLMLFFFFFLIPIFLFMLSWRNTTYSVKSQIKVLHVPPSWPHKKEHMKRECSGNVDLKKISLMEFTYKNKSLLWGLKQQMRAGKIWSQGLVKRCMHEEAAVVKLSRSGTWWYLNGWLFGNPDMHHLEFNNVSKRWDINKITLTLKLLVVKNKKARTSKPDNKSRSTLNILHVPYICCM